MQEPVLIGDPRIEAIAVRDCGEPMCDLEERGIVVFSDRKRSQNALLCRVREGVAARLASASASLPAGFRLLGVEGYRPPSQQAEYFRRYAQNLREAYPRATDAEISRLASRHVSPSAVAPHPSGAAIDLTLCNESGLELDLGCPLDATPEQSDGSCYTDAPGLDAVAARNRGVLTHALSSAGLVNYPPEWWHWSYGDRYWAFVTGAEAAPYGPVAQGTLGAECE